MALRELVPAFFLGRGQNSSTTAQRAYMTESIENSASDEFRAVGHGLKDLKQIWINFESNGISLFQLKHPSVHVSQNVISNG